MSNMDVNLSTVQWCSAVYCATAPYHANDKRANGYEMFHPPLPEQKPLVGQGLCIIEVSRSHSVGLLWTGDQSYAETST